MSFKIVETTLSADLAASGTVTFSYPSNTDSGHFENEYPHKAVAPGFALMSAPGDFTLTFGTANITFTYGASKTTIPEGTKLSLQLELAGDGNPNPKAWPAKVEPSRVGDGQVVRINIGAPDVADVDAVVDAQSPSASGSVTKVSATVTADVPRNVTLDTSSTMNTTQVVTVTGTDEYGETVVENLTANGTTAVAGKKAFKTVTDVSISAALTAGNMDVGFGDVFGLPVALPETGLVLAEVEDGVAATTAGTFVAAVRTAATATTGDVRGTYDPNSAADGDVRFELVVWLPDGLELGVAQFAG